MVFGYVNDDIAAQAAVILGVMGVVDKGRAARVQPVKAGVGRHPQSAFHILMNILDPVVVQAPAIGRVMAVMYKNVQLRVKSLQSSEAGADPENAGPVKVHRRNAVVTEAVRAAALV